MFKDTQLASQKWFAFILSALAVYRAAIMIATEEGPFSVFAKLRGKFSTDNWISRGLRCPLCISFWAGLVAAIPLYRNPIQYLRTAFALSGVTVIIHKFLG